MSEYEVEFLRLNCYAPGMMATQKDKSLYFDEGLRYDMKIQVASYQERVF